MGGLVSHALHNVVDWCSQAVASVYLNYGVAAKPRGRKIQLQEKKEEYDRPSYNDLRSCMKIIRDINAVHGITEQNILYAKAITRFPSYVPPKPRKKPNNDKTSGRKDQRNE